MDSVTWFDFAKRQTFGFDNANYAAALFVFVALALWLPYFIRKSLFPLSLVGSLVLTGLTLLTQSRGALVALVFGGGVILFWMTNRKAAVLTLILHGILIGAVSVWLTGLGERIGEGVSGDDGSINNRLSLWKPAPTMMVQAPGGWGWGQSAEAFHQWYQEVGADLRYKHLVNSHLTWLVEMGWFGRTSYLLLWALVLTLCLPSARLPIFSVFLGIWIAFGIASFFSGVAQQWYEWIIPLLALAGVLWLRKKKALWPSPKVFLAALSLGLMTALGLFIAGTAMAELKLKGAEDQVLLGNGEKELVILSPDVSVFGKKYGHAIRQDRKVLEGIRVRVAWVEPEKLGQGAVVLLSGTLNRAALKGINDWKIKALILINPGWIPSEAAELPAVPVTVFWGSLRQKGDRTAWEEWCGAGEGRSFREIPGNAEFIPSWFPLTLEASERMFQGGQG